MNGRDAQPANQNTSVYSYAIKIAFALIEGSVELAITHPLACVATRIQNHHGRIFSSNLRASFATFCQVVTKGGSLYSGVFAGFLDKLIIKRGYKFISKEVIKDELVAPGFAYFANPLGEEPYFGRYNNAVKEAVAGCITGPGEIVALQFDYWKTNKQNSRHSFQNRNILNMLFSKEGYVGWKPTFIRNFIGSGFLFGIAAACYPFLFNIDDINKAKRSEKAVCNLIGSLASVFFTMPPDVVKTRMQIARFKGNEKVTASEVMKEMWTNEGSFAFFKGGLVKSGTSVVKLTFALTFYQWLVDVAHQYNWLEKEESHSHSPHHRR